MNFQTGSASEALQVSNAEFIDALFPILPEQASVGVCSKLGDPTGGGWRAVPFRLLSEQLPLDANNYVNCASFRPDQDGLFRARKDNFAGTHFIMLDDVGTKVPFERLGQFAPTYAIETSHGNHQVGIALVQPITDFEQLTQLLRSIISEGLCDAGATGPATRWARLPEGVNDKPKYRTDHGDPFQCRLVQWNPNRRYTIPEIVEGLGLPPLGSSKTFESLLKQHGPSKLRNCTTSFDGEVLEPINGGTSLVKLKALLDSIDPDCEYGDWSRVLMAVYYETGGSDEGLALVDDWSSRGKKYKGIKDLELKWASFKRGTSNPVTIGSLKYMAAAAGADVVTIMQGNDDGFELCETEVVPAANPNPPEAKVAVNPLAKFSVSEDLAALERQMVEAEPLLGNIALKGQATAIYAAPNTGKTLIVLHLIIDAIKRSRLDPKKLYYINMDDNSNGLVTKAKLANEYGFQMLAEGHKDFQASDFRKAMEHMIATDTARDVSVVLDTLKKFADTMDKKKSTEFSKLIRQFSMKGGTVIVLGHTNKHKERDGKSQYSGTSDIVDDFDCVYIMDALDRVEGHGQKVVEFENRKKRGNVVPAAAYTYSTEEGISYDELLLSVEEFDDSRLFPLKKSIEIQSDLSVINAIKASLERGIGSKMKLIDSVGKATSVSQRAVLRVLEKYTGLDRSTHYWNFVVGPRGVKGYALLSAMDAEPA